MSGPVPLNPGAALAAVPRSGSRAGNTAFRAASGGGQRPVLTASARGAFLKLGRDGETALSRTEKLFKQEPLCTV